jgi:outer membrane protein
MNKNRIRAMMVSLFLLPTLLIASAAQAADTKNLNIAFANFKTCIEKSKMGQQEQVAFESMKNQMESILEEKEKSINEIAEKFNDPDYLDSLAPEAETELKRKFRALTQELQQQQQQYYNTLTQANTKVVQKLTETINTAAAEVAKDKKLDFILNEEGCFFANQALNVSNDLVAKLDAIYEKETKEKPATK